MTTLKKILLLTALSQPGWAIAESLDEILALKEAPDGIVIEVMVAGPDALHSIIEDIQNARKLLMNRFADLDIAVVSHGHEQFALTQKNIRNYPALESSVKGLVDSDINVHVCGTHASWYGITPEDYPDYIDVSATGPAQINDYLKLGYLQLDL